MCQSLILKVQFIMISVLFGLFLLFGFGSSSFSRIGKNDLCTAWDSPNEILTISVKNPKPIRQEQDCWLIETGEKDFFEEPIVEYPDAEFETNYTLIFNGYTKLRWIVANIPGEHLAIGDISKGNVLHHFERLDTNNPEGEKFKIAVYKQMVPEIKGNFENSSVGDFRYKWGAKLCDAAANICLYN